MRSQSLITASTRMAQPLGWRSFDMNELETLFSRNVAVGKSDIYDDVINFRFREEIFTVPTISTVGIATYNGSFYTAKVDKIRALVKKIEDLTNG